MFFSWNKVVNKRWCAQLLKKLFFHQLVFFRPRVGGKEMFNQLVVFSDRELVKKISFFQTASS